jgi:hypothetical protein
MRGYQVVRKLKDFIVFKEKLVLEKIIAIGNTNHFSNECRDELEESGVVIQNVSSGKPSAADIALVGYFNLTLREFTRFIHFNRPSEANPLSLYIVTGDRDFSKILNFLESVHYRVVLIHSPNISEVLRHSVKEAIPWKEVLGDSTSDGSTRITLPKIEVKDGMTNSLKENKNVEIRKSPDIRRTDNKNGCFTCGEVS